MRAFRTEKHETRPIWLFEISIEVEGVRGGEPALCTIAGTSAGARGGSPLCVAAQAAKRQASHHGLRETLVTRVA